MIVAPTPKQTRRMDDLGRVVIPKEIRKRTGMTVGDELDIYAKPNGEVVIKKHLSAPIQEQNSHGDTSL